MNIVDFSLKANRSFRKQNSSWETSKFQWQHLRTHLHISICLWSPQPNRKTTANTCSHTHNKPFPTITWHKPPKSHRITSRWVPQTLKHPKWSEIWWKPIQTTQINTRRLARLHPSSQNCKNWNKNTQKPITTNSLKLTETHRDSPRPTETHRDFFFCLQRGLHRDPPRPTETHRDSPRLTETCRTIFLNSCKSTEKNSNKKQVTPNKVDFALTNLVWMRRVPNLVFLRQNLNEIEAKPFQKCSRKAHSDNLTPRLAFCRVHTVNNWIPLKTWQVLRQLFEARWSLKHWAKSNPG